MRYQEDSQLEKKNILVTGASSGLGREIAITCSEAGANVALVGRNIDTLQKTLSQMEDGNHHCYSCDVTDGDAYDNLFNSIKDDMGLVSGFVHSAGIEITLPLRASSAEIYRKTIEVNTIAALELSRYAVKKKYKAESLSIIFIASTMGITGAPALTAYSASKGALIAAARSTALEYADKGVRFNCISPGHVEGTQMANSLFEKLPEKAKEDLIANHPLGLGQPRDIGNASIFLLSNSSRWITGSNLIVDGGYSAR